MKIKFILFIGLIFIILIGIHFHTTTLSVSRHSVTLAQGGKKLKIAHITDLHTKGLGRIEEQLLELLQLGH